MTEEARKATDFGADVFGDEAINTYLSKDTARKLQATIPRASRSTPRSPAKSRTASGTGRWTAAPRTTRTGSFR